MDEGCEYIDVIELTEGMNIFTNIGTGKLYKFIDNTYSMIKTSSLIDFSKIILDNDMSVCTIGNIVDDLDQAVRKAKRLSRKTILIFFSFEEEDDDEATRIRRRIDKEYKEIKEENPNLKLYICLATDIQEIIDENEDHIISGKDMPELFNVKLV